MVSRTSSRVLDSILIGFLAFVICGAIGHFFVGPPTCADGWQSLSIGHRGACSWHGGVVAGAGSGWALLASVGIAVSAGLLYWKKASDSASKRQ